MCIFGALREAFLSNFITKQTDGQIQTDAEFCGQNYQVPRHIILYRTYIFNSLTFLASIAPAIFLHC